MDEKTALTPLAVDLTREEFVDFRYVMDRFAGMGRGRWTRAVIMSLFSLSLIVLALMELVKEGQADWLTGIVGLLMLLISLLSAVLEPVILKKRAARAYDESIAAGYSYYGTVRLYSDRIEKEGAELTVSIPINGTAFFLECPEMMVWGSDRTRSIVLPARYLTPEFAAAVRHAADRIPTGHRRFYGRVVPQGQVPTPAAAEKPAVLWEQTVTYTLEELQALLRNVLVQNYSQRLPMFGLLSVMAGLAMGWNGESIVPCVMYFLATLFFLTLLNLLMPLWQLPRHEEQVPPAARQMQFVLTDRGFKLHAERQEDCVPWGAIAHIIDRGDYVEFQWQRKSARIPKRCIPDFEAFDGLITQYWKHK